MASEGEKSSSPQLVVDRPALTVNDRHQNFDYEALQSAGCVENLKNKVAESLTCSRQKVLSFVYGKLPILTWLIGYDVKNWLLGDLVAGVTVAIMHIPQGMGFALLANVPAICGIYMAFYQSLIYAILGTSQHNSMGSFAVITLMTGKVVKQLATFPPVAAVAADAVSGNLTESLLVIAENATDSLDMVNMDGTYTPIQIATVVTFMVGVWHMLFGILQLGSLAVFLSDMLVSGFTTAAAVHVLTSQMKDMLGITVKGYSGPLKIIYIYIDIFRNLPNVNLATLLITAITLGALIINNEVLKPIVSRYSKVPVPIELIAVIVGTASSYLADFTDVFDVKIIGTVPTGLPPPATPPLELLGTVAVDSLVIAIVSYTVNFSLAKIFAAKHGYPVDATQELYATGVGNIFSSFFACPPMASALARALIQDAVGGVTQMASLIVCAILLLVLLFIGPVFEALPKAVLASIIVVALKGMFWQVKDMAAMWSVSRIEAITWLVTFFSVVVIDIDYGLLVGVIFSLLVLLTRNQRPATFRLGRVPNTDLYLDLANYPQAREVPTLRLFKILGAIHFANRENLRSLITAGTGLEPKALAKERAQMTEAEIDKENMVLRNIENGHTIENGANVVRYLVLDVSGVSHVDTSGGKFLNTLRAEYAKADIALCLSGLTEGALDMMEKSGCLKDFPSHLLFHSLHDAVVILASS